MMAFGPTPMCSLDEVLEAALQADADLADVYQRILEAIAPQLRVSIEKEIDGSPDCGCCWFAIALSQGINGDTLTTRNHRLTCREFKGWRPDDAEVRDEKAAILRRAANLGLRLEEVENE